MSFFGMGPLELLLVAAIALVVFGPERLPELARHIGKAMAEVRRATTELNNEFQRSISTQGPGVARPTTLPGRPLGPTERPLGRSENGAEVEPPRPPY